MASKGSRFLGLLCVISVIWAQDPVVPSTVDSVPAGTILQIRLRQPVSSYGSKRDTPLSALVIAPVEVEGRTLIPAGAHLGGILADARRVGMGFSRETASLRIDFDSITLPGLGPLPLQGGIIAVDDSRETVDVQGRIRGIRATASFSSVLSGFAVSAASIDPMMLGFALSSSLSVFRIPESEIFLPTGAELRFKLSAPLKVERSYPPLAPALFRSAEERGVLTDLVRPMPFRTATDNLGTPSDLTSLLYIGSSEAIERAFLAAGWARSDRLDARSSYGAMRSVVENQGYREAPMSTLVLNGENPQFTFAKTLDTFFKRHHLRIYRQTGTFNGNPVWTSTATHDSGIGFSRRAKTLIHIIDENIDEERSKVINDLALTGCVDAIDYIDRPWVPRDAKNATGDTLRTDGRLAIISLNACPAPSRADVPDTAVDTVKTRQSAALRPVRDAVLTLRNDLARGNIGYQAYSGYKMARGALKKRDASGGRIIHYGGEEFQVVKGAAKVKDAPIDPGESMSAEEISGKPRGYATMLDFSLSAGYFRFANDRFTTQPINFHIADSGGLLPEVISTSFESELRPGWSLAPKFTLNSWKHVSNEFGYTYNRTALVLDGRDETGITSSNRFNAQIRQFTYNALFHLRPNGARFRPFLAAGPAFQLIRTVDSRQTTNSVLRFTVKDLGLIVGAYEFGTKPPLEGGGIFQVGFQWGGGFKYQMTPRMFLRTDFRETLTSQPDFWSKSHTTIREFDTSGLISLEPLALQTHGPLRHNLFTVGFGVSF